MAVFMKYEGIDGESEVRGKKGFIELQSLSWGASRATAASKAGTRGDAEVKVEEVVISKLVDSTSAQLFSECLTGKFDKTVELDFVTTGPNNKPTSFLKMTLEKCGISSYQLAGGGSASGIPMENMALNYAKVTFESFAMNDARNAIPFTAGFDIDTATPT